MTRPAGEPDRDTAGEPDCYPIGEPDRDPASERDRDTTGRPRNARPRDGLGRPLPRSAAGEPVMPEELGLTPARAVALAQDLIDAGRPFHAHEVLEAAWKSAPAGERDLWQGLAQLAVGLTHARRGNDRGAVTLLRRGAAAVGGYLATGSNPATDDNMPTGGNTPTDGYGPGRPHGIEVSGACAAANQLADQIERSGLESIPATDLRLQLAADLHPDQVP